MNEVRELGVRMVSGNPLVASELKEAIEELFSPAGTVSKNEAQRDEEFVERSAEELGMRPDEFIDLAREFVGDVEQRLHALETAVEENNPERARQVAHAVKGGASEMLLKDMAAAAARIESSASNKDLSHCGEDLTVLRNLLAKFKRDALGEDNVATPD
jgi:HPt (histidine-containing phosphotransfer) domain-containing protein